MSIAVNLDNGIKLVELVWDFSLQCVHARTHVSKQRAMWQLLINVEKTYVHAHTAAQALAITGAQMDRGT